MTTISSISVNPWAPRIDDGPRRTGSHKSRDPKGVGCEITLLVIEVPGADIGISTFATGGIIATEAEYVDFSMNTGIEVLVLGLPGIYWQALQIAA